MTTETIESLRYEDWFGSQQGVPYAGSYEFAKAAWEKQGETIESLRAEVEGRYGRQDAVLRLL